MPIYRAPRWGAIALGCLCATGAGAVLIEDVRHTGTLGLDHILALIVLVGTISAGHLALGELKGGRVLAAGGLALLFVVGSAYCVISTAGRAGEVARVKAAAAAAGNFRRDELVGELEQAKLRFAQAEDQAAREMTGQRCGRRCRDWRTRAKEVQARIGVLTGEIAALGPAAPVDVKLTQAAALIAAVPGVAASESRVLAALRLFEPFIPALFLELGSIVFFGIGLGHAGVRRRALPSRHDTLQTSFAWPADPAPLPPPTPPGARAIPADHPVVVALHGRGNRWASNDELAREMGVTKGEASKRWREVADQLEVVRAGRNLRLRLAA